MYVKMTLLYTNNWQFCMYVQTTSSQSSGVRPRFGSSWGPERRSPQVSIVRASAPPLFRPLASLQPTPLSSPSPWRGPRPRRPGALNAKKKRNDKPLTRKPIYLVHIHLRKLNRRIRCAEWTLVIIYVSDHLHRTDLLAEPVIQAPG